MAGTGPPVTTSCLQFASGASLPTRNTGSRRKPVVPDASSSRLNLAEAMTSPPIVRATSRLGTVWVSISRSGCVRRRSRNKGEVCRRPAPHSGHEALSS